MILDSTPNAPSSILDEPGPTKKQEEDRIDSHYPSPKTDERRRGERCEGLERFFYVPQARWLWKIIISGVPLRYCAPCLELGDGTRYLRGGWKRDNSSGRMYC